MKLLDLHTIKGPNIYSYYPVVVMDVDLGKFTGVYTDSMGDFVDLLLKYFPELYEHYCSKGYPGGFVERLKSGTLLGHVVEHLALELQSLVARPVFYGKTRFNEALDAYRIVYSYYNEALGIESGKAAFQCIKSLLAGKKIYRSELIQMLQEVYYKSEYGPSTRAIIDAAQKRGIPILPLSKETSLIQLGYGSRLKRIQATLTEKTPCIGVDLACDKLETKEFLYQMGLPVARGYHVVSIEEALDAMKKLGKPVVVKPIDGNQGKGVSLNIKTAEELCKGYEVARKFSKKILVEEYIDGKDYRLTIVDGKLVAASHRVPPYIIGDGLHTINDLIKILNSDRLRGDGHEKPLTKVKIDQVVLMHLSKQGLDLETVLEKGKRVFLRENGNLSTGGTAYDVTSMVHLENKLLVERAARVMGLDVAGIDLRTDDISKPISKYGGAIIEVNAAPGIRMHHYPAAGKVRNVADKIVEMLFPHDDGRIPIIAVTGTNGKTTTVRLIQHILMSTGQTIGMTTTDGIYINKNLIYPGDTTGPWSTQVVLKDPGVDIAVLEVARGGIIRSGLGYDRSNVGIVLNVSDDHLGLDGVNTIEEMANVKSLVVETVKEDGICVLNGDNPYTVKMSERCKGRIIYFTKDQKQQHIQKHLEQGGSVVISDKGMIKIMSAEKNVSLILINDIPMTWNGLAIHQIENVLATVAALIGMGIDEDIIIKGLKTFSNDIRTNPGRLNILEHNGWKLILDYGHNFEGYKSIINFAHKLKYNRLLGVIGVPGDRSNDSIFSIGYLVGNNFQKVWLKEDEDLRGRVPGEVAAVLSQGILQGLNRPEIKVIFKEDEALKDMLSELRPGDIGVIFYEKKPQNLLKIVEEFIATEEKQAVESDFLLVNSSK